MQQIRRESTGLWHWLTEVEIEHSDTVVILFSQLRHRNIFSNFSQICEREPQLKNMDL